MKKKLLCNSLLITIGTCLLISNVNSPKFTYKYLIKANSNEVSDMLEMYKVKQDFIKKYDELVLSVNEKYHREMVINNLDNFIDTSYSTCEYIDEKIVITIKEGKGGIIEGSLKSNICDSEATNYRMFIFDLLYGE